MSFSEAHLAEPGETGTASEDVTPTARPVLLPTSRRDRPLGNLPLPLASLIGRADAIEGVEQALERHPLVTLVGPGGVGKTRLAFELVGSELVGWEALP
jgi:hypothetical protein